MDFKKNQSYKSVSSSETISSPTQKNTASKTEKVQRR
tara:strand:+ start:2230 stop:2340 length:111 start_codon:yes stop_codon:yes gene_type:complete